MEVNAWVLFCLSRLVRSVTGLQSGVFGRGPVLMEGSGGEVLRAILGNIITGFYQTKIWGPVLEGWGRVRVQDWEGHKTAAKGRGLGGGWLWCVLSPHWREGDRDEMQIRASEGEHPRGSDRPESRESDGVRRKGVATRSGSGPSACGTF